ncbi:hypothetical protein R1sor_026941 [Riccia sorocarpa]|uniref:Protein SHORTAGE IN CHIASMATA 1 n=1 Tax=Riccia sorocarpa TaxID=122646 RepID=A0ABD3GCS9_9MARC
MSKLPPGPAIDVPVKKHGCPSASVENLPDVKSADRNARGSKKQAGGEKSGRLKTGLIISSLEVPTLQNDIPNYDWFSIVTQLREQQPRPTEEVKVQISKPKPRAESQIRTCISPPDKIQVPEDWWNGPEDQAKSIPELQLCWIREHDFNPTSGRSEDYVEFLEPHEMLELDEPHISDESVPGALPAHVLGHLEHEGVAEKEVECPPPAVTIDSDDLLSKHCTSKLAYDNVTSVASLRHYSLLREMNDICYGTINTKEVPQDEKSLFSLEVPLFWDDGLPISLTCVHSLTENNANGVLASESFERLPGLLNGDYFQRLIVAPELRMDDQEFQSIPVPSEPEWSTTKLQLATVSAILSECEPSPSTATDWLYLDWHLEQDTTTCNDAQCFNLHAYLERSYHPTETVIAFTNTAADNSCWRVALKLVGMSENSNVPRRTGTGRENLKDSDRQSDRETPTLFVMSGTIPEGLADGDAERTLSAGNSRNPVEILEPTGIQVAAVNFSTHDQDLSGAEEIQNLQKRDSATEADRKEAILSIASRQERAEPLNRNRRDSGSAFDEFTLFVNGRKGILFNDLSSQPRAGCEHEENSRELKEGPTAISVTELQPDDGKQESLGVFHHSVTLTAEMQSLIGTLASDYHSLILMRDTLGKQRTQEVNIPRKFGFDNQGNLHLMAVIKSINSELPLTPHRQIILRGLTALHVLRQTALNLFTYGIQVAHLYLENFFTKIRFLEDLILNSRVELEDSYNQVERGDRQDHPKLSHLERLLKERAGAQHKVLLIADRRAFFSLYKRLHSWGFIPYQIDRKEQYLHKAALIPDTAAKLRDEITDALSCSNCFLVPQLYITDSFPVEKFTLIIQYAYFGADATLDGVLQRGRCERHIFKDVINTDEGNPSVTPGRAQLHFDNTRFIEQPQGQFADKILKLVETTDDSAGPSVVAERKKWEEKAQGSGTTSDTAPSYSLAIDKKVVSSPLLNSGCFNQDCRDAAASNNSTEAGTYELILVANVSQQAPNRITERRSSYQKILALEKQKVQVVERELQLPVYLLLSPAVCVVVFTRAMLSDKPQNFQHEKRLLRADIDILLRAVNFAYRDCLLIFEGPPDFTTAVADILTDLHALATWLELQAQLFISSGEAITDKIIGKSVEAALETKTLNVFPTMTETPTIAEAFLTAFPSINPLTAHAVLSCCPLRDFISLTLEQQYALVQDWDVPRRSCELFKAQCSYREIVQCINETVGDKYHYREGPSHVVRGSDVKECVTIFDGRKTEVYPSNSERIINLTRVRMGKVLPDEELEEDLDVNLDFSLPEIQFEPWSSGPGFPTVELVKPNGGLQIRSPMNSISLESFPEFPPASEVTGEASGEDNSRIDSDQEDRTFGSHSFGDQDFSMQELTLDDIFIPNDEFPTFQRKESRFRGQDGDFLSRLSRLETSFGSSNELGSEGCTAGKQRKYLQSYSPGFSSGTFHSSDSGAFLGPIDEETDGYLTSSSEFLWPPVCEEKREDLKPAPFTKTLPFGARPTCKEGSRKRASLDVLRYEPQNTKALPQPSWTSRKFPKNNSYSSKETEPQAPRPPWASRKLRMSNYSSSSKETKQHSIGSSSILGGSVPSDKGPKLLLGLSRRGNDKQQRLVGINTSKEVQNPFKRQKILSGSRYKGVEE